MVGAVTMVNGTHLEKSRNGPFAKAGPKHGDPFGRVGGRTGHRGSIDIPPCSALLPEKIESHSSRVVENVTIVFVLTILCGYAGGVMKCSGIRCQPISHVFRLTLLLAIIASTSGCLLLVGAGAGAGSAAYYMGKLEDEVNAPVDDVHDAAIEGLKDLEMPVLKDQGDKLSGKVESVTADDRNVWIYIDSLTPSRSKITIRVGLIGDEVRSQQILKAIRDSL